jgi:hypothetical protein
VNTVMNLREHVVRSEVLELYNWRLLSSAQLSMYIRLMLLHEGHKAACDILQRLRSVYLCAQVSRVAYVNAKPTFFSVQKIDKPTQRCVLYTMRTAIKPTALPVAIPHMLQYYQ